MKDWRKSSLKDFLDSDVKFVWRKCIKIIQLTYKSTLVNVSWDVHLIREYFDKGFKGKVIYMTLIGK